MYVWKKWPKKRIPRLTCTPKWRTALRTVKYFNA